MYNALVEELDPSAVRQAVEVTREINPVLDIKDDTGKKGVSYLFIENFLQEVFLT
jgi:hypothetical protein